MSDQAHDWTDEQIANLSARIREAYDLAAKEMQSKLDSWLKEYDRKREEWEQRVKSGDATQEEYQDWLSDRAMDQSWQQDMIETLSNDAVYTDEMCRQLINDEMPTIFAENANFAAFDIDSKLGYDTGFTLVDRDTVMRLIKNNPELLPAPEIDQPKDKRWNREKFASAVTQGVLQGESVPNLAKRLRSVFDMDRKASVRAARTSFTSAENAGRINSYKRAKRLGISMQQEWLATLDLRTRHTHRLLDGQRVSVGGYFEPEGYGPKYRVRFPADPQGLPAMIWNCRCTLIAAVEGVDTSDAERWSKLPDGMSYEDWKSGKNKVESEEPEKKPTIADLKKNLAEREEALKKAVRVQKPSESEERRYRNEVKGYKDFMESYARYLAYDRDDLTAQSTELENRIYEIGKLLDTLSGNDPNFQQLYEERIRLYNRVNSINAKLDGIQQYERYKQQYEQSQENLKKYLEGVVDSKRKYEEAQASIPSLIRERNLAVKALSEAQSFGPQIREKVGDDFADAMDDALSKAEERHPAIVALYRMFSSGLKVNESEKEKGAEYNWVMKGIYFNAEADAAGSSYERPYEIAFHEFAHMIDNICQYDLKGLTETEDLRSVLMSDWASFRNAIGRADGVTRDKNGHAINKLREEMNAMDNGALAYASVSDMIEACTRQSYPLGFGHGASYHRQDNQTVREFLAEVCASAIVNEASYEQMRRIFPNAVDMLENMIRGIVS